MWCVLLAGVAGVEGAGGVGQAGVDEEAAGDDRLDGAAEALAGSAGAA